jgi:enoyl-CoA hydratase/carnithine racemase
MWQSTLTDGGVVVLTYRRPPENVIGFADLAELDRVLVQWADDERARVIVLTGGAVGTFVAHADLADVAALIDDRATGPDGPDVWARALGRLATIPQPVVAAVNGQAWGGGCELALACTLRVAAQSAHFRFVEVANGAIPGAGGTQRLPRLIGFSQAARLVLGGERIDADRAAAIGLVDAVLPDANFIQHALAWVAPIATQPRHSLVAAKRALVDGASLSLSDGLELEQGIFRDILRSAETRALHLTPRRTS